MGLSTRRMLLLNGYGNNLGDQAIMTGSLRVFDDAAESLGIDLTVDQSFIYDFPFRESTIRTVNDAYDLVVLGGGGFLYHRSHDRSASGWGFDIPEALIDALDVPFAIYATGYNYRAFANEHFPSHTASHVRRVVERAAHFSVRERGSLRMIEERFGVQGGIDLVPDCALHVEPLRVHLPRLDAGRPAIGLCLRLDKAEERIPPPFAENFERYIRTLVDSCAELVHRDRAQIVYTPHLLTPADIEVGRILEATLPADSLLSLHREVPSIYGSPSLDGSAYLAGVYQRLDAVIAQRLHSIVLPFAVGTPAVSISSTASNAWMQEELGAPREMHIDLTRFDEEVRVERVVAAVRKALETRAEFRSRAFVRRGELLGKAREATRKLFASTLGKASGRVDPASTARNSQPQPDTTTAHPEPG